MVLHIAGGVRRRPGGSKEDWGWILSTSGTPRLGLIREEGCGEELEAAHEELPPLRAVAPDSRSRLASFTPSRRRDMGRGERGTLFCVSFRPVAKMRRADGSAVGAGIQQTKHCARPIFGFGYRPWSQSYDTENATSC